MANIIPPVSEVLGGDQIEGVPQVDNTNLPTMPDMTTAAPQVPLGAGMSPEQMKADLDNDLAMLDAKSLDIKGKKAMGQQAIMNTKRKILGALFDMLKKAGVDPNNLESINKFLTELESQDPDLAILFEEVFNSIGSMDSKSMYPPAPPVEEPQLMDKFKNLGAEMMMPKQ